MTNLELSFYRDEARRLKLRDWQILYQYTLDELGQICNGLGAKWADWITVRGHTISEWLDSYLPEFVPASLIHDVKYANGGTDAEREQADDDFCQNCISSIEPGDRAADRKRRIAQAFHFALRVFGRSAWASK